MSSHSFSSLLLTAISSRQMNQPLAYGGLRRVGPQIMPITQMGRKDGKGMREKKVGTRVHPRDLGDLRAKLLLPSMTLSVFIRAIRGEFYFR